MTVTVDGTLGVSLAAANSVPLGAVQSAAIVASSLSGAQTGSAPIYGCRAWCNFVGATGAINSSGNVASVTRNGTGDYTVTFVNSMPDANYAIVISGGSGFPSFFSTTIAINASQSAAVAPTTTTLRFATRDTSNAAQDPSNLHVMVMR